MSDLNKQKFSFRKELPAVMIPRNEVSIWGVLKNCIGKDLSKTTMPVELNEPLSFLQRLCEYMEYSSLLTKAVEQLNPADRMKYVCAFAVSALASNWERLGKPFNPLLGETYELKRNDYSVICEQVSHHPPISAFHAESPDFKFHGSISPKLKFWGKSVEIKPDGLVTVEFPKWNEVYSWRNVNCCVHNIIVGKLWIEQYGTLEIVNHCNGYKAVLNFKTAGWNLKDLHKVEGYIADKSGRRIYFIFGKWTEFVKCVLSRSYDEFMTHKQQESLQQEKNPQKVLSKLHSFKMTSFRSLSIQDDGRVPPEIEGDIPRSDTTYSLDIPGAEELWQCDPRPQNSKLYYQFTNFAMSLNEMEPYMKQQNNICPTDSRLRPDILCLERGDLSAALKEKTRLEEKQRNTRKLHKAENEETLKPRWFELRRNAYNGKESWVYQGQYWDRKYSSIQEIF